MRLATAFALFGLLLAGPAVRAADPPEGSIGVIIKHEDGKIVVVKTAEDGPAEKAGIKPDDVIVKVNDLKAENVEETAKEIVKHKPGEKIKVTVKRGDKEMVIEVTVGKRSEIKFPPIDKDKE